MNEKTQGSDLPEEELQEHLRAFEVMEELFDDEDDDDTEADNDDM